MILYINTTVNEIILISLRDGSKEVEKKVKIGPRDSDMLLIVIEQFLKEQKVNLKNISKIVVANIGGSFTSLRLGVTVANALAYALDIPVIGEDGRDPIKFSSHFIVSPVYDREPNIGIAKKKIL